MFQPLIRDVAVALSHRLSSSPLTTAKWASPGSTTDWPREGWIRPWWAGGVAATGPTVGRRSAAVRSAAVADPTVGNGAVMDPVGRHVGVGSCSPSRAAMAMIMSHRGDGMDRRPNSPFLSRMDPAALCLARRLGGG